jgi:hypothetical protein
VCVCVCVCVCVIYRLARADQEQGTTIQARAAAEGNNIENNKCYNMSGCGCVGMFACVWVWV